MGIIEAIIEDVQECDRRIVEWFNSHGEIKPSDIVRIHRPDLVKIRLDVMAKLGFIEIDKNGVARQLLPIPLGTLPMNSDVLTKRLSVKIFWVVYKVIADHKPRSIEEVKLILSSMFNYDFKFTTVRRWLEQLRKYGVVEKVDGRYIATVNLLVDDCDKLFREWLETKRVPWQEKRKKKKESGRE